MPICLKAPPSDRWFKDSGINGHMFDQQDPVNDFLRTERDVAIQQRDNAAFLAARTFEDDEQTSADGHSRQRSLCVMGVQGAGGGYQVCPMRVERDEAKETLNDLVLSTHEVLDRAGIPEAPRAESRIEALAVQRDAALARAERAEKELAELKGPPG
jgi:hypothetical protein